MITSTSNARVKELVQLQKKSKVRNEQGVFLVEGVKMYQEIPQEQLVKVYVSETFADKQKEEINRLKDRRKLEYLSDHVFQYVSDTKTPQGILCVVRQSTYCLEDILEAEDCTSSCFGQPSGSREPWNDSANRRGSGGDRNHHQQGECGYLIIRKLSVQRWVLFTVFRLSMWKI